AQQYRGVLHFVSEAREILGSEPARVHHAPGRRGCVAARGASAAGRQAAARIGMLIGYAEEDPETKSRVVAFRQMLEKRGWSEGGNIDIEARFVAGSSTKYEPLAKELVSLRPDVILAHTTPVTAALQRESASIPIVFVNVSDPIGSGFIASLARPGGN